MNIPKLNIKGLKLHKNGRLFGFGVSPNADWKILAILFAVLLLCISIITLYVFIGVDKGDIFIVQKPSAGSTGTLNAAQLKRTIQYYEDRSVVLEGIRSTKDSTLDPSL